MTIFLSLIIIISCSAKFGSSQLAIPPLIVNDNSCLLAKKQRSAILQLTSHYISTIAAEVKLAPQCGEGLWCQVAYLSMNNSTQVE